MSDDDSLIDQDLVDESNEGLTNAFQDYNDDDFDLDLFQENDDDDQRRVYVSDAFQGTSATKWRHERENAKRIDFNGAEKDLLIGMKAVVNPTLATCERLTGKPQDQMNAADFAAIYLNRNWYLLMQDYINFRIDVVEERASIKEIFCMLRVWLLQSIFQVTAKKLFVNPLWYGPIRRVGITYARYSYLITKLGADSVEISAVNRGTENQDDRFADSIWGSFNQYNDVVEKLERHIGEIGQKFVLEKITDLTIDNDKLRHQSNTFKKEGLQLTGFCGSRCGPVMNCVGTVQSSLILSIYFSRKGDGILNTVVNLVGFLGYGNEPTRRHRLDVTFMVDRGYHIPSVIQFFLSLRASVLGTHSEKAGNWCFCTGGDPKENQKVIPVEGARAVFFASRKVNNAPSYAMCYRNGSKGVGNIHSTLPFLGVWDLVLKKRSSYGSAPWISYKSLAAEVLHQNWLSKVLIFVACQACTPWFEARMGHLTGTTVLKTVKALKFSFLDASDKDEEDATRLFLQGTLGLKMNRKTEAQLAGVQLATLKKAYKSLGF